MHSENNFELTYLWTVGGSLERKGLGLVESAGRIPHAWRILLFICIYLRFRVVHLAPIV